ncbi:hypothetical protein J7J45_05855 [Candidatus Aerophobetes bacterium]|nr:hypothetical protein [Candidatus Aerophobetes bacterium]
MIYLSVKIKGQIRMNLEWKRLICLPIFIIFASTISFAQQPPKINRVIIVSSKNSSIPDSSSKIVKYNDEVRLYAVLKCGKRYYLGYSKSFLPDKIKINGKVYSVKNGLLKRWRKESWGELKFHWYKIMPRLAPSHPTGDYKWYSNVFSKEEGEEGRWKGFDIIEYKQYPLKGKDWSLLLKKEVGTERFRVEVLFQGKVISSPGKPDPNSQSGISPEDYYRGIKKTVHRISRLSNHPNKLIRYIEALRGVPWVWGVTYRDPPKNTPSRHQADFSNPVGIECADLVISALRAMGNKNLNYTAAENLVRGEYTNPAVTTSFLTYSKFTPFKNWTPRGIFLKGDKIFIFSKKKIQIRSSDFDLIKEIKIKDPSCELLDIAVDKEKIYTLIQKNLKTIIATVDKKGIIKKLFTPKINKTIKIGKSEYQCKIEINPTGIDVTDSKEGLNIYLLSSGTIYVFNSKGENKKYIPVKEAYKKWDPTGSLSVTNGKFYLPAGEKKILVCDIHGKIVDTINLKKPFLDADVDGKKIAILYPFPLKVQLRKLDGSLLQDFTGRFLTEKGEKVKIKIGSSPEDLHIGDLILTVSPTYHTLLLYADNGNGIFDGEDELICAGHNGVEVRKANYLEGRKFIIKRLKPGINYK